MINLANSDEKQEKKAVATYKVLHQRTTENGADTEQDVFEDAFEALKSPNSVVTTEQLRSLEVLAHDMDFGSKLVDPQALSQLLHVARSSSSDNRKSAFRILGSSLRNNEAALRNVNENGLISDLLDALKSEEDGGVKASLIFSLSAVTAKDGGFKYFIERGGSQLLREAFATKDPEVQGKCATFVEDNYSANRDENGVASELTSWCSLLQEQILENPSGPNVGKILTALTLVPGLTAS
jgi:Nucleotide exchange factor SIL1